MKTAKVLPLLAFLVLLIKVSTSFAAETRVVRGIVDPEKAESNFSKSLDDELTDAVSKRSSSSINKQVEPHLDSQLHWAVRHNKPKTVKALLIKGANPKLANKLGNTALHEACQKEFFDIIKELIHHVDAVDKKNYVQMKNFDGKSSLGLVQDGEIRNYLLSFVSPDLIEKKIKELSDSLSHLKTQLDTLKNGLEAIKEKLKEKYIKEPLRESKKPFPGEASHKFLTSHTRERVFQKGRKRPSNFRQLSKRTTDESLRREKENLLATIKLYKDVLYILKKKAHEKIKLGMLAKSLGIRKGGTVEVMGRTEPAQIIEIEPQELEEEIKKLEASL